MKPTKNKVFCKDCGRTKMLFETEKKADNFMAFNKKEIEAESGYSPQRSYFCVFCGGWHVTSIKEDIGKSMNEKLLENYLTEKANKTVKTIPKKTKIDNEEKRNKRVSELENQIQGLDTIQMELFFTEQINLLKKEIGDLTNPMNLGDKEKTKELRQELEIIYVVRKQNGFQTILKKTKIDNEEKRNKRVSELENQIQGLDTIQMELFFMEQINLLNKEIEDLTNPMNAGDKEKIKELRQELEITCVVRKQKGFQKTNNNIEKKFKEWELWLEKKGYN